MSFEYIYQHSECGKDINCKSTLNSCWCKSFADQFFRTITMRFKWNSNSMIWWGKIAQFYPNDNLRTHSYSFLVAQTDRQRTKNCRNHGCEMYSIGKKSGRHLFMLVLTIPPITSKEMEMYISVWKHAYTQTIYELVITWVGKHFKQLFRCDRWSVRLEWNSM